MNTPALRKGPRSPWSIKSWVGVFVGEAKRVLSRSMLYLCTLPPSDLQLLIRVLLVAQTFSCYLAQPLRCSPGA